MLAAAHRMRSRLDFDVARTGRRAGTRTVLVSLAVPVGSIEPDQPSLVGFVVSRAVGGAAARNRVKRRLRSAMAARLSEIPAGARVVVRAQPAAACASYAALTRDVDSALRRALGRSAAAEPGVRR